jgi:hypothetical protein
LFDPNAVTNEDAELKTRQAYEEGDDGTANGTTGNYARSPGAA